MKNRELILAGRQILAEAGIEDADTDAWLLFSHITGMSRTDYFMQMEDDASSYKETYLTVIGQRAQRRPLQYITGTAPFMGLEFAVSESVLIPRFDTENLVEECLKRVKSGDRILDVCTGSGCILVSILAMRTDVTGVGCDLSCDALAVAEENRRKLLADPSRAELVQGDLMNPVEGKFDLIVSNPPYIPTADIEQLLPEVRDYEPRMALDGTEDGLYFYKRLVKEAPSYLNKGGWLLFEIGYDQGDALRRLLSENGYVDIEIKKDLAGLDRVAIGRFTDV